MPNEKLFVKSSFTPQLQGVNLVPPAFKSWSEASDEEVAEYLQKHYAGEINLHEIWNIGDTRTVHLSAMPATGVGESHAEQDVEFQIVNAGGKELVDGRECAFIVQLKDLLTNNSNQAENGYINSTATNVGGWKECARRAWCNNVFRAALPEAMRNLFKLHKNKTSQGNKLKTLDETEDYFALPCAYNILGRFDSDVGYWTASSNEDPIRWAYYITYGNDKKYKRGNSSGNGLSWWTRSPFTNDEASFCYINTFFHDNANKSKGIAPFGTI